MQIIHHISDLQSHLSVLRKAGKSIGFVPTMGALHQGHASLIVQSVAQCDCTVVSIFVNPTQFNDPKDLHNYPRTLDADCQLIADIGDCLVFVPEVAEMYPTPDERVFSYPPTDSVMEGKHRPGHFNGVCQIVSKLFDIVQPSRAYFGEKDFQQIAVIRAMMADLNYEFDLVACPIVRESDGLAMSSRNSLLSNQERETAAHISRSLFASLARKAAGEPLSAVRDWVIAEINRIEGLEVEYFEIVDALTLRSLDTWQDATQVQGCITVFCGSRPVRLIDNIKYA